MKLPSTLTLLGVMFIAAGCQTTQSSQPPADTPSGFPAVGAADITQAFAAQGIENVCATQPDTRAQVITRHNNFKAHPVELCDGDTSLGRAIYWSRTNAAGNRLFVHVTSLGGTEYPTWMRFDGTAKTNTSQFDFTKDGTSYMCDVVKPNRGISPIIYTACVAGLGATAKLSEPISICGAPEVATGHPLNGTRVDLTWTKNGAYRLPHTLLIENVDGTNVTALYAVGRSSTGSINPSCFRVAGTMTGDLITFPQNNAKAVYRVAGTEIVGATYTHNERGDFPGRIDGAIVPAK